MSWTKRRVLVTGAGGFIGSHVCERLVHEGATVTALVHYNSAGSWHNLDHLPAEVRAELNVVAADIQDPFAVRQIVSDHAVVLHLAALIAIPYSYVAPQSYLAVNASGTLNVLEACRAVGVDRLVHTSTSEVYGTAQYVPMDEKHPLHPQSPYAATKVAADKLAESYHLSFGLPVSIIRPFNTFGPRQSGRAVVPTIVSQLLSGGQVKLGALDPIRDLTFVKDTAEAFLRIAAAPDTVGVVTNVGTGRGISVGALARLAAEMAGRPDVEITADEQRLRPEASEVLRLECDATALESRCGWRPATALRDGLAATIDFIRQHPELYRPERYTI